LFDIRYSFLHVKQCGSVVQLHRNKKNLTNLYDLSHKPQAALAIAFAFVSFPSQVAERRLILRGVSGMQFVDLAFQQNRIRERIEARVKAVLDHNQYIMGPEIKELEERLASYVGVKHAVACSSGTDALLLALMAHDIGPGDAVFTTPFTFIATAEVIGLLGAVPVFVDIDWNTYNISPASLEMAISAVKKNDPAIYPLPRCKEIKGGADGVPNAKGIIAVDLFGLPADYDQINAVARKYGLFVIEDGAQSFGGEVRGMRTGSLAEIGCTSFFPAKPLGCYGDGGMCFTADDDLAELMRSISQHGKGHHKYENVRIGVNGRLDTLQAAILVAKFEIFPEEVELRQSVARSYTELIDSTLSLITPRIPDGYRSVWAQYTVKTDGEPQRSWLQSRLAKAGIPTAIYYPRPLHLQGAFRSLGYKAGDFPVSEECCTRVLSLPMHPYLKQDDLLKIVHHLMKEE
jgi:UDP-2-acetamido-2-deoxy-ribo-hexuluronate aminotransferase